MTLNKAIEIQTINNDNDPNYTDAERREAHQLGLQALKKLKANREYGPMAGTGLLPGETQD